MFRKCKVFLCSVLIVGMLGSINVFAQNRHLQVPPVQVNHLPAIPCFSFSVYYGIH